MNNALVLVFDRLGSAYLGPYGNTWVETPAWNRLAARSQLVENALVDSPDLALLYDAYLHGQHALAGTREFTDPSLAQALAAKGVQTWLVTDEPLLAEHDVAHDFDERVILPVGMEQAAEVVEQTQLGRLFATVLEVLEQARPPFLIWVHAQAMQGPWDAPYALRAQFAEEEDPDPPQLVIPPDCHLDDDYDPDLLLGLQHAYGGQVALLDTCLGILLDAIWTAPIADTTAVLATAARGFPLGEHQCVGPTGSPLNAELLQVPWIMHWPDDESAMLRTQQLVQPSDLYPTLGQWYGLDAGAMPRWGRSLLTPQLELPPSDGGHGNIACSVDGPQRAIRVPAWFLRQGPGDAHALYVKPDDRWEFNEISNRCEETVRELSDLFDAFHNAARAGDRQQLPELAPSMLLT